MELFKYDSLPNNDSIRFLLEDQLKKVIGKGKIGKARDIAMIIDTLRYCNEIGGNIVLFSEKEIKAGRIKSHYLNLQGRNKGIIQVGPKIASFYLRDLVLALNLESYLKEDDFQYLQPIDTWVEKIFKPFFGDEISFDDIRKKIVQESKDGKISPMIINQGAWVLVSCQACKVV